AAKLPSSSRRPSFFSPSSPFHASHPETPEKRYGIEIPPKNENKNEPQNTIQDSHKPYSARRPACALRFLQANGSTDGQPGLRSGGFGFFVFDHMGVLWRQLL
ncbi:MAG: hypothetical protein II192_06190, partial [Clostridia bacterium]|nr:hypothetical protein [Clostridia bacterium]